MDLGQALRTAMQRAQQESKTYYVFEPINGTNVYQLSTLPPDNDLYYRLEPNRIITTVVGRGHRLEKDTVGDAAILPTQIQTDKEECRRLGRAFWFNGRSRELRESVV